MKVADACSGNSESKGIDPSIEAPFLVRREGGKGGEHPDTSKTKKRIDRNEKPLEPGSDRGGDAALDKKISFGGGGPAPMGLPRRIFHGA